METAEILKDLKRAMGAAGVICGIVGIIATIVIYFVLSPIIDRLGATAVLAMDHAESAVGGGIASLDSASNSVSSLSKFSTNMSSSIVKLENGSRKFSYALSNLSKNLGMLNLSTANDSIQQLNDSAGLFSEFSTSLEETHSSLSSLSSATDEMSSHITSTRDSVASAEGDISDARDSINQLIGGLKLALLVGTFIEILVFLTLICYSVGILI
jgi:methyl-accepting chemotaxis protein